MRYELAGPLCFSTSCVNLRMTRSGCFSPLIWNPTYLDSAAAQMQRTQVVIGLSMCHSDMRCQDSGLRPYKCGSLILANFTYRSPRPNDCSWNSNCLSTSNNSKQSFQSKSIFHLMSAVQQWLAALNSHTVAVAMTSCPNVSHTCCKERAINSLTCHLLLCQFTELPPGSIQIAYEKHGA